MRGEFVGIERNAHRHTLDNLDPVTGGVLRWQERKSATGADAEALDLAVVGHVGTVEVGMQRHRLPDTHVAELRFLEIGIDPQLIERHHRHQRQAGLDALTDLYAALRDIAGNRRQQAAARVVEISATQSGSHRFDIGMGEQGRVIDHRMAAR